ncbi:MAG TPA: PHP domain-containing protein [Acholeplasmataceae bacterium]|nr:PHP domain-containing protein [Acholeplasmataceae bacterium]
MKHDFNFHSHTYLCGHAGGNPIEYVKEAIKHNFSKLGISEHAPMPNLPNNNSRLKDSDYKTYLDLLNTAKIYANNNNLIFYKGLEIEYFKDINLYTKYLDDLDYLILGQHYILKNNKLKSTYALDSLEDIIIYRDTIMEAIKTGYFNLICHPDLCFYNILEPTSEMFESLRPLVKLAKELDIPLEVNANGFRRNKYENHPIIKYPRLEFFKIVKEENAKVIISSDAHSVSDLNDWAITKAYEFANELNLNIVTSLKFNYYENDR